MSKIIIRSGKSEDINQIREHLINLWVEHAQNEPTLLEEKEMRNVNVDEYYNEALENSDKSSVFIAEDNGKIVGFLKADVEQIDHFFLNPQIIYLDDIFVLPEYRRKGIAKTLVKEAEKLAKEKGIKRIQARVYSFNKRMQSFLESQGYHAPYATWDKTID